MLHTALHSTSGVGVPAQHPEIHEVHQAAVFSPRAQFCSGAIVVVTTGAVAEASAITDLDGPVSPARPTSSLQRMDVMG